MSPAQAKSSMRFASHASRGPSLAQHALQGSPVTSLPWPFEFCRMRALHSRALALSVSCLGPMLMLAFFAHGGQGPVFFLFDAGTKPCLKCFCREAFRREALSCILKLLKRFPALVFRGIGQPTGSQYGSCTREGTGCPVRQGPSSCTP